MRISYLDSLEVRWRGAYGYVGGHRSFQLFGFDFMVTDEPALDVKLIEVNSSPAVAEQVGTMWRIRNRASQITT